MTSEYFIPSSKDGAQKVDSRETVSGENQERGINVNQGVTMSRTSDKKGHKCPRPGCNGFCSTGKVGHAGKETRRKRVCRVCGAYGPTKEINMPGWVFPLFDDAGPVKKHRAVKVPAAK